MDYNKPAIEKILGLPFIENNYVRLLKSGKEIFETIFDSITNAKHIICIEFYIFKNDDTGKRLSELLKEKARQGIKVYILYDHFGSLRTPAGFWQDMKKAGINLKVSHPLKWSAPRHYIHRDHKKLLVIDGEKAFTGGFNIGDEYHGYFKKLKQPWRDTGIYLEGPIAAALLEIFKKIWTAWKGNVIVYDKKAHSVRKLNIIPDQKSGPSNVVSVIPIFTSSARARKRLRKLFFY